MKLVPLMLAVVGAAVALTNPAAAEPGEVRLASVTDDRSFTLQEARGRIVALHFLTRTDTPECTAFVREYLAGASGVAGVRHVFVKADEAAAIRAWWGQFKDDRFTVAHDSEGKLAQELKVPGGLALGPVASNYPATIVLDEGGKEMFRHVGSNAHEHLAFGEFAKKIAEKTRAASIAQYNLPQGQTTAVNGYDVVAYVKDGRATKGAKEFVSSYRGVSYRFAGEEHRRLFAAEPEKYLPTYGGWCASAMGDGGRKVEIDPTNFKVKDGRIFLFYKSFFADAKRDWDKREKEWEPAADVNWKKISGEEPTKTGGGG